MTAQSLQSFRRTVTVAWPATQVRQAKAHLIRVARAGHQKIMQAQTARSGEAPSYEVYANVPGRSIDNVVLPGPIVYRYRYVREIVKTALEALRKASPRGPSGRYAASHFVYLNGVLVTEVPVRLKESDEIMIINPVAYSRRLEIGKTESGRDFLISVPNRIYERVAKNILIPRFRNVARITFDYATVPDAYRLKKDNPARSWLAKKRRWYISPKQRSDRAKGAEVRSPAIVIRALI